MLLHAHNQEILNKKKIGNKKGTSKRMTDLKRINLLEGWRTKEKLILSIVDFSICKV
jgi:hypothetical protein